MRKADIRAAGAMRAADPAAARGQPGDHPGGLRGFIPGDRWRALRTRDSWDDGGVPAPLGANAAPGSVPDGGQRASRSGAADGDLVGTDGSGASDGGFNFDRPVAPSGYAWWYVDAISDEGTHGFTLIAFVGSVFSPYYAWARRRGAADPSRHCAVNVALYGPRSHRWAMTERGAGVLERDKHRLRIGPSSLAWSDGVLTIRVDEVAAPIPSRVRGEIRVHPPRLQDTVVALDRAGRHRWIPMVPSARIEVALDRPALRWTGTAYCDRNEGDAPLQDDFRRWNWCRAHASTGTTVLYDLTMTDGGRRTLAMRYGAEGGMTALPAPPECALPRTIWGIARTMRADTATVLATLEDTPFYARSLVEARLADQTMLAMHESLDLERFKAPWVQALLPFRMPRAWW
jgi:carotenoid 1,2-hydratase